MKKIHMMADLGIDAICGVKTRYFEIVPVIKWRYVTCKRCLSKRGAR